MPLDAPTMTHDGMVRIKLLCGDKHDEQTLGLILSLIVLCMPLKYMSGNTTYLTPRVLQSDSRLAPYSKASIVALQVNSSFETTSSKDSENMSWAVYWTSIHMEFWTGSYRTTHQWGRRCKTCLCSLSYCSWYRSLHDHFFV